jgi:hypothetical protein
VALAAMNRSMASYARMAAAALMIALIGVISLTGKWPTSAWLNPPHPEGILDLPSTQITRIEVSSGDRNVVMFEHQPTGGWLVNGGEIEPAIAQHVDIALRMLNVSNPLRILKPDEYNAAKLAEFGLERPNTLINLFASDGKVNSVAFGEPTPAQNAQYVRVIGRPNLFLLQRYVGVEWQVALDMLVRAAPSQVVSRETTARPVVLLFPVSVSTIWAVEVVDEGVLTRLERDPAGDWFHHFGEHSHSGPAAILHKADPQLAPLIAAELAALERVSVEAVLAQHPDENTLAQFGLEHPSSIMLLYTRDSSGPVAHISFGNVAEDGLDRYARVQETEAVVAIPGHATDHLIKLLQLSGVRP